VPADRGQHDLMHVGRQAQRRAFRRDEADLAIGACVIAHACEQAFAIERDDLCALGRLDPYERSGRWLETPSAHDLDMRADRDVGPSTPQGKHRVVGRQRCDRQLRDLIDRARVVVIVWRRANLAARPAPRLPQPRRVAIDDRESLACCDQRFEIGNGATALNALGVFLPLTRDLGLLAKPAGHAVIGRGASALDLGFERIVGNTCQLLPA
jgi:hypothetical protein